jgi:hypothetical protein
VPTRHRTPQQLLGLWCERACVYEFSVRCKTGKPLRKNVMMRTGDQKRRPRQPSDIINEFLNGLVAKCRGIKLAIVICLDRPLVRAGRYRCGDRLQDLGPEFLRDVLFASAASSRSFGSCSASASRSTFLR